MSSSSSLPTVYLKMGEIAFAERPMRFTTVLGSCVAVTFYDHRRGYAAMCHGVMPACRRGNACRAARTCVHRGHYVDCSVRAMADRLLAGGRCADIEARVFGGAELFTSDERLRGLVTVGPLNVQAAMLTLRQRAIAVTSTAVGGGAGYRIYFSTLSGEVTVNRLDADVPEARGRDVSRRQKCRTVG